MIDIEDIETADPINLDDNEARELIAEIKRLRKLMAECPECRLQAKIDRLVPNPDNKTIDELRAEEEESGG